MPPDAPPPDPPPPRDHGMLPIRLAAAAALLAWLALLWLMFGDVM